MDDGTKAGNGFLIHTDNFAKEGVERLIFALNHKFGLHTTIRNRKPDQYAIYIPTQDREAFLTLIRPFILPSMSYKIQ